MALFARLPHSPQQPRFTPTGDLTSHEDGIYRYFPYRRIELGGITVAGYNPPPARDWRQTGEAGMHTVEMLERLKELAENAGYTVRHEWLGGVGGGACQFAGRKWIFVDLSLSVVEQLDQVAAALKGDAAAVGPSASSAVQRFLQRAA